MVETKLQTDTVIEKKSNNHHGYWTHILVLVDNLSNRFTRPAWSQICNTAIYIELSERPHSTAVGSCLSNDSLLWAILLYMYTERLSLVGRSINSGFMERTCLLSQNVNNYNNTRRVIIDGYTLWSGKQGYFRFVFLLVS